MDALRTVAKFSTRTCSYHTTDLVSVTQVSIVDSAGLLRPVSAPGNFHDLKPAAHQPDATSANQRFSLT